MKRIVESAGAGKSTCGGRGRGASLVARLATAGRSVWRRTPAQRRPLWALSAVSFLWLALCLALGALDPRQVLGVSTWVKPAKFAASIAITAATLAWVLGAVTLTVKVSKRIVAVLVIAFALELVIISVQAGRGVPSHFNNATTLDAALFSVMGVGIVVATLALAYVAARALRQRFADAPFGWGIRLGFVALLLGSAVGGVMPRPTAAQVEGRRAGRPAPLVGAHTVGVADGGPGLPIVGFSTEGGDLRVAHFMGLHGFQVLPLVGWWVGRRRRRAPVGTAPGGPSTGGAGVVIAGVGYLGLTVTVLVQALRGQPLLQPDGATWALAGAVIAGCAAAFVSVLVRVLVQVRVVRPAVSLIQKSGRADHLMW